MPENGLMIFNDREIQKKANERGSSKLEPDHPSEFAKVISHPECCARITGNRQTFIFVDPLPGDPYFHPMPKARRCTTKSKSKHTHSKNESLMAEDYSSDIDDQDKEKSETSTDRASSVEATTTLSSTSLVQFYEQIITEYTALGLNGKPSASIINMLDISGRIYCTYCGKELAIGIGEYIFRVNFGTEAHCFWIPTVQYQTITGRNMVSRGTKGSAYTVPTEYIFGPSGVNPLLSVQLAFVRPDWTLIMVDHNVLIQFHVMRLRRVCTADDFVTGSPVWLRIWSATHGPVHSSQPQLAEDALKEWRCSVLAAPFDDEPIYLTIKRRQDIFNGYGVNLYGYDFRTR
ncbi:hypothetical protein BJ912DRAFT_1070069 [Pholiota molesta]|nr:hypothetical protein BJ912DRAFT_1070069 [Pholiota molesta]